MTSVFVMKDEAMHSDKVCLIWLCCIVKPCSIPSCLFCCRILYWSHFLNCLHTPCYMNIWLMSVLYQPWTGCVLIENVY